MKCEKCGNDFEVPKFAIDLVYASYCLACIKVGLRAYAKLPIEEIIKRQLNSLGLCKTKKKGGKKAVINLHS